MHIDIVCLSGSFMLWFGILPICGLVACVWFVLCAFVSCVELLSLVCVYSLAFLVSGWFWRGWLGLV